MGVEMGISLGLRYPPIPPYSALSLPLPGLLAARRSRLPRPFSCGRSPPPLKTQGVAKPPAALHVKNFARSAPEFPAVLVLFPSFTFS